MGRPRVYENDAARQKAFRERKKLMAYAKWKYKAEAVRSADLTQYLNEQEENGFELVVICPHDGELMMVVSRKSTKQVTAYGINPQGFR